MLQNKAAFFAKYNILEKQYKKTKLNWSDLEKIYQDYENRIPHLNSIGLSISNALQTQSGVHSVRYRVKEPEHLIEKIIRKHIENPNRGINLGNYDKEITDLVGVRAIHLFKSNWAPINTFIQETWELHEKPIAYIRNGDDKDVSATFENQEFEVKEHAIGYRSLHYIIKTRPTRVEHFVEIQVRTLFEEGWSEIDHKIRYPYDTNNDLIKSLLMIFNRLAGSADEMADYVRILSIALKTKESEYLQSLSTRENEIQSLKDEIGRLKIKPTERVKLIESIDQISKSQNPFAIGSTGNNLSKILSDSAKLGGISSLHNSLSGKLSSITELIAKSNIAIPILEDYAIKIPSNLSSNIPKEDKKKNE